MMKNKDSEVFTSILPLIHAEIPNITDDGIVYLDFIEVIFAIPFIQNCKRCKIETTYWRDYETMILDDFTLNPCKERMSINETLEYHRMSHSDRDNRTLNYVCPFKLFTEFTDGSR